MLYFEMNTYIYKLRSNALLLKPVQIVSINFIKHASNIENNLHVHNIKPYILLNRHVWIDKLISNMIAVH